MKRHDEVSLNPQGQAICRALPKKRHANNRKAGTRNAKRGPQSNEQTDLEGIGAEFAFAKLFNSYPDFSIQPRNADEDGGDCKLRDGRAVDLKATQCPTGKLIAVPWKKAGAKLFALMTGVFPNYVFRGFMEPGELLRAERLGSLGHGPTYIAEQDELVPFVLPVVEG
jgi:hypothetical protein